jgi:hypothetical protein
MNVHLVSEDQRGRIDRGSRIVDYTAVWCFRRTTASW